MAQLKKRLSGIPSLKLISRGTRLRYELLVDGPKHVLELEETGIRLLFHFAEPNDRAFSLGLIRLFVVLAIVDDLYIIKLGAIYGYVVDVLSHQLPQLTAGGRDDALVGRLSYNIEALSFANSKLSHEVYNLAASKKQLSDDLNVCREFCLQVLKVAKARGAEPVDGAERVFGIDSTLAERVAAIVKRGGA